MACGMGMTIASFGQAQGRQPVWICRKGSDTPSGEATCGSTFACRMMEGWQSPGFHPCCATQCGPSDVKTKSWKRPAARAICRRQCNAARSACSNRMQGKTKAAEPRQSGLSASSLHTACTSVRGNHCLPVLWDTQAIGSACFTHSWPSAAQVSLCIKNTAPAALSL